MSSLTFFTSLTDRHWRWITFALSVIGIYYVVVALTGFKAVAIPIHFGRIALAVTVNILFIRALGTIFQEIPAPRRDYLIAGVILNTTSALGFTFWNQAGRQFGVDTSIFTSPVAGFFSLLLDLSFVFMALAAPPAEWGERNWKLIAVMVGIAAGILVAVVAPLFQP